MNEELEAFKAAFDAMDFDKARELADIYVTTHPGEFVDYADIVTGSPDEESARKQLVKACEVSRDAGLTGQWMRAEAFQLHRWHPIDAGGSSFQPQVRNGGPTQQVRVRNELPEPPKRGTKVAATSRTKARTR